jgi:FtsP/CotA-like multicopper oxidase with cupredoxin domain
MAFRIIIVFFLFFCFSADILAGSPTNVQLAPAKSTHTFPFFRSPTAVLSYNDQIPGPLLRGVQGTVMTVDVLNQLQEPTSIHWHGLRIDNAMDGVPG